MLKELRYTTGYASVLAGALLMVGHCLNLGGGIEFGTIAGSTCVFTAHLLLTFALIGLYAFETRTTILGLVGMILGVVGTIASTAVVYVEISGAAGNMVRDVYASGVPYLIDSILPVLFVIGLVMLGISVVRGNAFPRMGGYLLIVGTILFAAASFAENLQAMMEVLGALVTGSGFIRVGLPLISRKTSKFAS